VSPQGCTWHEETVCKSHWPVGLGVADWPASFWVSLDQNFLDTCLHKKGKAMEVEKVGWGQTHWSASHVARPGSHHLVSYYLGHVGGAPPWSYKYPLPVKVDTHTTHFGDSTCIALFLSVVARRSLVGRVVRLWGLDGLPVCREPSS
jgi:hypothetical protein